MSESELGFRVTATRQNAGSFFRTPAAGVTPGAFNWSGRRSPGSVNSPAGTDCAKVIEVSGKTSLASASQEDGAAFTNRGTKRTMKSAAAMLDARGCILINEIPTILVHVYEWRGRHPGGSSPFPKRWR